MDNEKIVEQPKEDVSTDSTTLGDFANPDELYKSYKNLQAEFTRKSQELAQLKLQNDNKASMADSLEVDSADLKVVETRTEDDIVREYLFGVARKNHSPIVIGQATTTPQFIETKKSIADANAVARKFFGGN